ncbi:MAG: hypothetical protein DIU78_012065 [Pseudomonadota bacterium]|nr:MAG: hypothetical protein DIU78_15645 [Pseudomonadota bacterium]
MTRAWVPSAAVSVFGLGLTLGSGCTVTALAERERPVAVNECETDSDCGPGGFCSERACFTRSGSLSTLLFEVTPTAAAGRFAGERLTVLQSVPVSGGFVELELEDTSSVRGRVKETVPAGCEFEGRRARTRVLPATDGTIPVRVSLSPSDRRLGLTGATRFAEVETADDLYPAAASTHRFDVRVPAGTYDLYIEPFPLVPQNPPTMEGQPPSCGLPPQLLLGQRLVGGPVDLTLEVPAPAQLALTIRVPAASGQVLSGWFVDMIEPATGRVISTRAALGLAQQAGSNKLAHSVQIAYLPVAHADDRAPDTAGKELVRLTPPEDVVAPTLFFERAALEIFTQGSGTIELVAALPRPVRLEGQVIDRATGEPRRASVTLTATRIHQASPGTLASFVRVVETDADGWFRADVIPGTYAVHAVPAVLPDRFDIGYAIAETIWEVAPEPAVQAGRAIELDPAPALSGRVLVPGTGDGALGANVWATVSPSAASAPVLDRMLGDAPPVPRPVSALIADRGGRFRLDTDRGLLDVSVRPPDGTRLAWLVMPGIRLEDSEELGLLRLPLPVRLEGTVSVSGLTDSAVALSRAHLRAYALLDEGNEPTDDIARARAAVPVAEARLDTDASFVLHLPASLHPGGVP